MTTISEFGSSKTIISAAAVVAFFAFLSRLAGFIRDRVLAGTFGAGETLDAYYTAFLVPDLIFNLLVFGALSASFIPLFSWYFKERKDPIAAWRLTNSVLNLLTVFFLILAAVLSVIAGPAVKVIAPGFSGPQIELTAQMMRVMFLAGLFLAISIVYGSALQAMKRFLVYSVAPILYNFGIIAGAIFLTPTLGAIGLAWGVVLGAAAHLFLQWIAARAAGYRYQWVWAPKDKDTLEIGRLMIPRLFGLGVGMLNMTIMTMIATTLAVGSVTIFNFAKNIQFFPVGIIGVSLAIAAFPSLTEEINAKRFDGFIRIFQQTTRHILFFMIPASIVFLLLRAQIVRVVVGAGTFSWSETILTADTLAFFTLSMFAQALIFLLVRAFFTLKDTWTPFIAGLAAALVNLLTALLLVKEYGVVGLGLSFSLGTIVNLALLWAMLRLRVGSLREQTLIGPLLRFSAAGLACGVMIQIIKPVVTLFLKLDTFWNVLLQGLISGAAGLIVYGLVCFLLRSPEVETFFKAMRRRLFRQFEATEPPAGS